MSSAPERTHLAFQHDGNLHSQTTTIVDYLPALELDEANTAIFKGITLKPTEHVVITKSTIFHPQGGGQPSDTGAMTRTTETCQFNISATRTGVGKYAGQVLHLGSYGAESKRFNRNDEVIQTLDVERRNLYSKYHTAGHVLGSAVRHLYEKKVPGFDELKASHFPDSASCEFAGLLDGAWKQAIQDKVDEFVEKDMPVEIEFWDEEDFKREGLDRLIPDREAVGMAEGEKFRVVRIVGAEVYPCGGTHVASTQGVKGTKVTKIKRQKGQSKVSYSVD